MYYTGKKGCSNEQLYFLGVTVMHIFYATIASRDIFDTGIIYSDIIPHFQIYFRHLRTVFFILLWALNR